RSLDHASILRAGQLHVPLAGGAAVAGKISGHQTSSALVAIRAAAAHERQPDRRPPFQAMKAAALLIAPLGFSMAQAVARGQETTVIPAPVTAANYVELLERPPFRRHLSLPEALVLSG